MRVPIRPSQQIGEYHTPMSDNEHYDPEIQPVEIEHVMLDMMETDPQKFQTMCKLLGVDPDHFARFLKEDVKKQTN